MRFKFKLLLLFFISQLFLADMIAQSITIKGKITAESGTPISGASVLVKGTKRGVSTDETGDYTITLSGKSTLVVTAIGYKSQELTATKGETLNLVLENSVQSMSEVVVTALGIKREKRQLTYSTQEVKGDVLTSTKETNVLNAMTGRVSGVQITSSSGQPGSSSRIVIRGVSSITGDNEALIVMDGIPINNAQTGNAGPGNGVSRLSDIDPEIIESINVLKGSAASALYGSKAARGVVMITTKNGSGNRKPKVSLTSQFSMETPILPEFQSTYAQGSNGLFVNGETSKTSEIWGPRIDTLKVNGQAVYNKNAMHDFFQKGLTYTNTLSVAGGVGKSNYFMSYSYLDQKGTVPTTGLKRHTAFGKFTSELSSKLSTTFQFNYISSVADRIAEGWDVVSPLWTIYTAPRTWNPLPMYDANGIQRVFRASRNNPYWSLENSHNKATTNRFLPTFTVMYKPTSWLTVTERMGADIYAEQQKYYESPSTITSTTGIIRDNSINFRQFNHDLIIEARKQFDSDWDVSFMVGNNVLSTKWDNYYLTGTGTTIDVTQYRNLANAATITASQSSSLTRKVGFYAQSLLEYKRMFNLALTGRYDGSSVLSAGNNFYPYGSASLGFIFSEAVSIPGVDFGKLRLSYSSVGNDNIGAYSLATPYTSAGGFPYSGVAGFRLSSTLGNSNLVNEKTNEFETGLEMRFLHSRLGFEASYFDRKHNDLLSASVALSAATGYGSTILNAGNMTNKGFEILVNATPVKSGSFSWDVTATYTKIKNLVTRIYQDQPSLQLGQTYAFVGQPYGSFYNTSFKRDNQGRMILDANGLPQNGGTKIVGNIQPDWLGGITNTFKYRGVSLNFFFDVRKGGDLHNQDDVYGYFYGTTKATENRTDRVVAGVTEDGKENTKVVTAKSYYQRLNTIGESGIQDGSYIKLRNVNLGYIFSKNTLAKTPFANAALTLTGRNLWIHSPNFTGADPEVNSFGSDNGSIGVYTYSVPTSRSYNLTLNVTFK